MPVSTCTVNLCSLAISLNAATAAGQDFKALAASKISARVRDERAFRMVINAACSGVGKMVLRLARVSAFDRWLQNRG